MDYSLQNDIAVCQRAGYANAVVELCEAPLITSLRIIERTHINEINIEKISSVITDYPNITYMGLSYGDDGNIIFTFCVND